MGKWVNQHVSSNPYCILSPIFSDYEKHLKKLEDNYETEADDGSDEDVEKPVDGIRNFWPQNIAKIYFISFFYLKQFSVSKDVKESTTASVVTSFASSETETTTAASLSFANAFNSSKSTCNRKVCLLWESDCHHFIVLLVILDVFTGFSGFGNTTSSTITTGGFTFAVGATDASAKISPVQGQHITLWRHKMGLKQAAVVQGRKMTNTFLLRLKWTKCQKKGRFTRNDASCFIKKTAPGWTKGLATCTWNHVMGKHSLSSEPILT